MVDANPQNWSVEQVAAALRVALDDLETFEQAGADLPWPRAVAPRRSPALERT